MARGHRVLRGCQGALMVGVPAQRVVEVRCPGQDGTSEVGTGTVIGERLVLTAAHVVHDEAGNPRPLVRLRRADQTGWIDGQVLWPTQHPDSPLPPDDRTHSEGQGGGSNRPAGNSDSRWDRVGGVDVALVRVTDPAWQQPALDPIRLGRLTGRDPNVECTALGFPQVLRTQPAQRTREVLSGRVVPIGDLQRDRYDIHLNGARPAPGDPGAHPWGGMSGAGLFAADLLIGVIIVDQPNFAHDRLTATPLTTLTDHPGFARHLPHTTNSDDSDEDVGAGTCASSGRPGRRRLVLDSVELSGLLTRPARQGRLSPAQLLVAERAVVPWHGRTDLLTEITRWCTGSTDDAAAKDQMAGWPLVRLLTGPGGQGKTRLALHLAHQMRTRHGWTSGLLRRDTGSHTASGAAAGAGGLVDLTALGTTTVPVLLIVDYAETRPAQLNRLLTLLADTSDTAPIRVLLLARAAGDWYDQLLLHHQQLLPDPPTALPTLDNTPAARATSYHHAASALARQLPLLDPTAGVNWASIADALPTPNLTSAGYGSPLTLHLLALTQLLAHGPHPLPTTNSTSTAGTLEAELLRHEARYWHDTARQRSLTYQPVTLARAVAAASLLGAPDEPTALATVNRTPGLTDLASDAQLGVALWLRELYPHPDGQYWGSLQPDRLTEEHLAHLTRTDPKLLPALLGSAQRAASDPAGPDQTEAARADAAQTVQAITVLARTAPRHPHLSGQLADLLANDLAELGPAALIVATQTPDPRPLIDALLQALRKGVQPAQALIALGDQLPQRSLVLDEVAHHLTQAIVDAAQAASQDDPSTWHPVLAKSLNNRSVRLAALGRREDALAVIEQAVTLYRELAAARPDAFTPALAGSLHNLCNQLAGLGRREEALAAIEQAVTLRRELAATRPETFTPDLASSLNNLSSQQAHLGRREDALATVQQAVTLRRELAATRPETFTPDLASSLKNLSGQLADLGRLEDALAAIEQAVTLHRELAAAQPDAFIPDLASSLNNLSNRLGALGRREAALAAIEQAVTLHRELATARPDTFTLDLATCLNNLSGRLGDLGRREDARTASEQAVKLRRKLAAAWPARSPPTS